MMNINYLAGLEENSFSGWVRVAEKIVGFLLILLLVFLPIGCLMNNDEYDQANRQRDEYNQSLQEIRIENDQLNNDIRSLYKQCDELSTHLATLVACGYMINLLKGLAARWQVRPVQEALENCKHLERQGPGPQAQKLRLPPAAVDASLVDKVDLQAKVAVTSLQALLPPHRRLAGVLVEQ